MLIFTYVDIKIGKIPVRKADFRIRGGKAKFAIRPTRGVKN